MKAALRLPELRLPSTPRQLDDHSLMRFPRQQTRPRWLTGGVRVASCRRRARCAILAPGAVTAPRTPARMYITDARHFLDKKGAIAARRGPAKVMADFHAGVIACAADFEDTGVLTPTCFKCKKAGVRIALAQDDAILWSCPRCTAEGRISNWQGTLWDLSERSERGC